MQLKIFQWEYSQIAVITSCNNPVLFAAGANSERDQVIDLATIKP